MKEELNVYKDTCFNQKSELDAIIYIKNEVLV